LTAKSRQELATWLHSEAQGKLLHLAFKVNFEFDECRAALEEAVSTEHTPAERHRFMLERFEHLQQFVGLQLDEFNESVLRKRAHDLYPPALTISLDFALRQLLSGTASFSIDPRLTVDGTIGVKSDMESDAGDIRESLQEKLAARLVLSSELKYAIYRCIEEGLNNALKHRARNISVSVEIDNLWIVCRVENDGDPLPADLSSGIGLVMVDTLVKQVNGDWSLKTVGGRTVFTLQFPKPLMTASKYLKLMAGADG
jgi:signal transduction histidine kinase